MKDWQTCLVVAELKVKMLDPAVGSTSPVAAKQGITPQQVERPCRCIRRYSNVLHSSASLAEWQQPEYAAHAPGTLGKAFNACKQ